MNQMLKSGQVVTTETSNTPCRVEQFIGAGGQGEVYRAVLAKEPMALKWYFPSQATKEQREALETLVRKESPNDRFLWPLELVSDDRVRGYGYIMPLRPPGYKNIVDLMKRRVEPTFRALATIGFELADSFKQLHAKGLCYRDINFQNVFFEPNSGRVLICDNDNVSVDGTACCGVLGTPRFMAPEIVRGETKPNSHTDLFSLAVLLFYLLMIHHPLEGKKEASIKAFDLHAMNLIYGREPVFIFDPENDSNRPVKGYQDNAILHWPIYPEFVRELFTRSFTEGIRDPVNGRVRESEWRDAMIQLRDSIIYCPKCASENFYDYGASEDQLKPCWNCKTNLTAPLVLKTARNVVMLNYDTVLYPHHIDDNCKYEFSQTVGKVVQHPKNPNVWGLQNTSDKEWDCFSSDGSITKVSPGRNVTLKAGIRIGFGNTEGEIQTGIEGKG